MYQSPKISLLYPRTEELLTEEVTETSDEAEEKDNLIGVDSLLGDLLG